MKTKKEHIIQNRRGNAARVNERGNALIYVLIAIVLFAALSFTLGRQTDTSEAGALSDERAELRATQLISYAAQAKSVVDQMLFAGADIDDLDFMDPSDPNFNAGTQLDRANRVFHPEGGGLVLGQLPEDTIAQVDTNPVAGWYIGRFNNVEWTESPGEDVILVALQISRPVCEKINEKINGSTVIPTIVGLRTSLVDDSFHSSTNANLLTDPTGTPNCAACHGIASLCVINNAGNKYAFYTVVADQ